MTISDLIARLSEIQKKVGSSAQVKLGSTYNTTENAFNFFDIHAPSGCKDVYLIPTDIWDRNRLKAFAQRESQINETNRAR